MTPAWRSRCASLIGVACAAACFYASTGLHDCWPLAWIAPLPLLVLRDTPGHAWIHGFVAYGLGLASSWPAYVTYVPPAGLGVLFAILSALFGAVMALTAWITARVGPWPRVLAYPVAATALDALSFHVSPDLASQSLAYTQTGFLPIVQTAALVGPSGIVFLMALLASAIAGRLVSERLHRPAGSILWWVLAVEAVALGLGYTRVVALRATADTTVRVGVAASDPDIRFFRTERRDEAIPVVEAYARRVRALADRGAVLVVLPEKMVGIAPSYRDDAQAILAAAARDARVRVVAGLNLTGAPTRRNVAWVFGPDGRLELEYDKRLLVPGYEDAYQAGTEPGFVATDAGVLGIAICRDLHVSRPFRAYGRAHTRILLAPAWDFTTDAEIQARQPVLRAVEGGYPVVRAAQEGFLVVVDAAGRVLLRRPSWEQRETLAVVDVPLARTVTPYAYLGDAFAAAVGLGLVMLIGIARRGHARSEA